jgi:hypothetical protein
MENSKQSLLTNEGNCITITSKFVVTKEELKKENPVHQEKPCNEKSTCKPDISTILLEIVFGLINNEEENVK